MEESHLDLSLTEEEQIAFGVKAPALSPDLDNFNVEDQKVLDELSPPYPSKAAKMKAMSAKRKGRKAHDTKSFREECQAIEKYLSFGIIPPEYLSSHVLRGNFKRKAKQFVMEEGQLKFLKARPARNLKSRSERKWNKNL